MANSSPPELFFYCKNSKKVAANAECTSCLMFFNPFAFADTVRKQATSSREKLNK